MLWQFHPEIAKLPQFASFSTNPLEAFYQLSFAGWLQVDETSTCGHCLAHETAQILVFIGVCESFSFEKVYYTDKAPGDLGFDPLRLGSNPASRKYYAVSVSSSFSCLPPHSLAERRGQERTPCHDRIRRNASPRSLDQDGTLPADC